MRTNRVFCLILSLLLCAMLFAGCQSSPETPVKGDFSFSVPEGFAIENVTDTACSIVNADGVTVGGIILTELEAKKLKDSDDMSLVRYLDAIAQEITGENVGSEFFSWNGEGSVLHYLSQYVTDPATQERLEYYRVFFEKDSAVYDMWFDKALIDEDSIDKFIPIAEGAQ